MDVHSDLTLDLIEATVLIEQTAPSGARTVGTAFLVQAPGPDGAPRVVMVTAAHVLESMPGAEVKVGWRFGEADGAWRFAPAVQTIRTPDRLPKWTRHPTADVAVMEIVAPEPFAKAAVPLAWLADDDMFEEHGVGPGDEMMTLGYPRGLSANRAGFPILRTGRVASFPLGPGNLFPTFLLDVTVLPGNSGGPVFLTQAMRRRPGTEHGAAAVITGVLTRQVEMEIGVVTHARYVRETIALLDGRSAGGP